jgi:hypothetical protein
MSSTVPNAHPPSIPESVPRWKGRPVPWVAQWTGEVPRKPRPQVRYEPAPGGGRRLAYQDATEADWWAPTDNHEAVLWRRTGTGRQGEPQYAMLNTIRQRQAMTELLCQVCGRSAATAGGTVWLMHSIEWQILTGGRSGSDPIWAQAVTGPDGMTPATTNPPTCASCWRTAARMCPSIRKHGAVALVVGAARPVAVTGDVFPAGAGIPEPRRVDFGDDEANRTIARLLVVELDDVQVLPNLSALPVEPRTSTS